MQVGNSWHLKSFGYITCTCPSTKQNHTTWSLRECYPSKLELTSHTFENQLNKKCIVTRYENITIWQCILIISLFGVTFCVYIFVSEIKQTFFLWIHYWLLWITKALSYLPSTIYLKSCSSQDLTTIKVTIELLHCNYTV